VPEPATARRARLLSPLLALLASTAVAAEDCEAIARRMSVAALDQMWGGVLEDASSYLESCAGGPQAEKAAFYKARALDRLRRFDLAFPAYRSFMDRFCPRGGESFLCEDATVSLYTLAADRVAKGEADKLQILLDGLRSGDFYSKVFAGVQISKLPSHPDAKAKALPVLVEAHRLEDDPDFRNEICLAILRIDPSQCGGGPGRPGAGLPEPQMIRVRVWDCNAQKEKVSVNLPFSFARAAIESLGPEILNEVEAQGFDLENAWETLKKLKPNERFQLSIHEEDECLEVEIWFE
jgi:hypothetical protein